MQRPNRNFPQTKPPPQRRHRAIAELDNHIAQAEADLARWHEKISERTAVDQPCRMEQAMVRLAERKLAQLRRSHLLLTSGGSDRL